MKLDKAIELNGAAVKSLKKGGFHDHADAVQLGIEALKRVKACRPVDLYAPEILLPGETQVD